MKVIIINGSPRKEGNTSIVLDAMAEELAHSGLDTEIIQIGAEHLHGCIGCAYCRKNEKNLCVFTDDSVNEISAKMRKADGIILGSPTYYGGIAGTMKCFLDRVFYSGTKYFRNKIAAVVAITRRSGAVDTANQLSNYPKLAQMIMPPSQYWPVVYGALKGEVLQDAEGMQTARKIAQSMAWLLKSLEQSKDTVPPIPDEKKTMTNFIR